LTSSLAPLANAAANKPARKRNRIRGSQRKRKARANYATQPPTHHSLECDPYEVHWAMHGTAINPDTTAIAEYRELSTCSDGQYWQDSNADEIGRMFQGLGAKSYMPTGTNTLWFIHPSQVPKHKKATYVRVVCADRPEKYNPRRVRWTAAGDRIHFPGNKTTKTADLTTSELMFNSVISTPGGRFMSIDLKDFYLCSDLEEYEYVHIPLYLIPESIMDLYDLHNKLSNGHVYAEVRKEMYRLPQAGRLDNEKLRKFLEPHGYVPCHVTPGLWKQVDSNLMFTLVVDNFGVCYTNRANVERLLKILKQDYELTTDWEGTRYVRLTLDWDYANGHVNISMPGYVQRALQRFDHNKPRRAQDSPHEWTAPIYGSSQQYAAQDNTPALDLKDVKRVQEVLGTFLYYGRAVDCTMLAAIGSIATHQASATKKTIHAIIQRLDYAATHPDAIIRFNASDMVLYVESDSSYLSKTKAHSRVAGYHYLSTAPAAPLKAPMPDAPPHPLNGPINVPCKILREVLSSAAKAELGGLYYNGKEAVPERITLEELGHKQEPQLPWSPTTPLPMASPTIVSSKNAQKLWTCVFTGFRIAFAKANLLSIGNTENATGRIILRNAMR
jgi:hypothetical protein